MAAFRFLALLTVGFVFVVLVFLLHAGQSRLELEGTRFLSGPDIGPKAGEEVVWTLDLGGQKVTEAWPGAQRQPRLFVSGGKGAKIRAQASYVDRDGASVLDAFVVPGEALGAAGERPGELAFGALWMSWEHPLVITLTVLEAGEGAEPAQLLLRGEPTQNYIAARAMARTLWIVFSIIGALGIAGLLATHRPPPRVRV